MDNPKKEKHRKFDDDVSSMKFDGNSYVERIFPKFFCDRKILENTVDKKFKIDRHT